MHKLMSANLNKLKLHWKREAVQIPPQRYKRLIKEYREPLLQVTAAKGVSVGY